MYTLEGLDKEYVKNIYQNTVLYSIYKYEQLDDNFKPVYNKKYQNALELKDKLGITETPTKEEVTNFLNEQKEKVENIQKQNQEMINIIARASVEKLISEMPVDLTNVEKYQYLFDFVTKTMKFDSDWYEYCANVPPIDGYDFMFDNGVPVSETYGGLLVTRVGNSDDITNLMIFLGKELGIKIEKTYCKYNSKRRAINYVNEHGFISYMDPIAVIRGEKDKDKVFLVAENELDYPVKDKDVNKVKNIDEDEKEVSISLHQMTPEPRYNMDEIIAKINELLPKVNYIKPEQIQK